MRHRRAIGEWISADVRASRERGGSRRERLDEVVERLQFWDDASEGGKRQEHGNQDENRAKDELQLESEETESPRLALRVDSIVFFAEGRRANGLQRLALL